VNTFGQDTFDGTELEKDSTVSSGNEDDCRSCRANQYEENGSDTHRDVEANCCLWQHHRRDCEKYSENGKGKHFSNSP